MYGKAKMIMIPKMKEKFLTNHFKCDVVTSTLKHRDSFGKEKYKK